MYMRLRHNAEFVCLDKKNSSNSENTDDDWGILGVILIALEVY